MSKFISLETYCLSMRTARGHSGNVLSIFEMGNNLGYYFDYMRPVVNGFNLYFYPEVTPSPYEEPTYDPLQRFPKGRKKRIMQATLEELKSAKIALEDRDYCAHLLLKFRGCRKANWPFVALCRHEKHEYLNCQYEDFVIRMKEYERERRLRTRKYEAEMAAKLPPDKCKK